MPCCYWCASLQTLNEVNLSYLPVLWSLSYWGTQALTWFIIPFHQSFNISGEFSGFSRLVLVPNFYTNALIAVCTVITVIGFLALQTTSGSCGEPEVLRRGSCTCCHGSHLDIGKQDYAMEAIASYRTSSFKCVRSSARNLAPELWTCRSTAQYLVLGKHFGPA